MKKILLAVFAFSVLACSDSKKSSPKPNLEKEKAQIRAIFDQSLTESASYYWLESLCKDVGARLSGSPEAEKAVLWGEKLMKDIGLDTVYLQPVMVPKWVRGPKEEAEFYLNGERITMEICALGGSIATPKGGLRAQVVEVNGLEEADALGDQLKGKIVFYNRAFDQTLIQTFKAYGGCVDQRVQGAEVAAKHGALGVIVRSMSSNIDPYPHTGTMRYGDLSPDQYIPSAAISTRSAEKLSQALKEDPQVEVRFEQHCENQGEVPSYNVIGELKGSQLPDHYITIGGHLDSWDLGEGAHDDGTGVVQSMEVLHFFKSQNIKPRHTLRAVLFMNEENGLRGGLAYAEAAKKNNEIHTAALESDAGGHSPRGFSIDPSNPHVDLFKSFADLFKEYGASDFSIGGSGADIGPLKNGEVILMGYRPDSQRYFDYHHSTQDTYDKVNRRELALGSASMASLVYLIDNYVD